MTTAYYIKAAGFALCLSVPLMCPLGAAIGTYWLCPLLFFVVLPLAGRLMGGDPTAYYPAMRPARAMRIYFDALPYLYLPIWLGSFCWTASKLSAGEMTPLDMGGAALSLGIASAVSTCVAHEIMHRTGRFDQAYTRVMIALCGYGHLMLKHSAHHAHVGDLAVGGTPRRGETAFSFVWRDAQQGLRNAIGIETQRLYNRHLSAWRSHIVQNYALAGVMLACFTWQWGMAGSALFIFQAGFSVFAVQMITYIQHYGLARSSGEPIAAGHSWADNCVIANALTLNNNHHSQHHMEPRTPYYHLRTHQDAPRLPASYMMMFVVALLPPLWRLLMDKRLSRHEQRIMEKAAIV